MRSSADVLLSIHEESHSQRARTDQRQDAHLPLTGQNPREAACHRDPTEPKENPPGEEWTDGGICQDAGECCGCVDMPFSQQNKLADPPPLLTRKQRHGTTDDS